MNNQGKIKKNVTSGVKFDRKNEAQIKQKNVECNGDLNVLVPWYIKECIDSAYTGWSKDVSDDQILLTYASLPTTYRDILSMRVKGHSMSGIGKYLFKGDKDQMSVQNDINKILNLFIGAVAGTIHITDNAAELPGDTELESLMIPREYVTILSNAKIKTVADAKRYIKSIGDLKSIGLTYESAKRIASVLKGIGFDVSDSVYATPVGGYIITGSIINQIWEPAASRTSTYIHVDTPQEVNAVLGYAMQKYFRITAPTPKSWFQHLLNCKSYRKEKWIPYSERVTPYDWSNLKCNCKVEDPAYITYGSSIKFGNGRSCAIAFQDHPTRKHIMQYTIEVHNVSRYELENRKFAKALSFSDLEMVFVDNKEEVVA